MDTMKDTKMQPATDAVIEELRMLAEDFKLAGSPMILQTRQMSELLDRLEAAEKKSNELKTRLDLVYQELSARRDGFSGIKLVG